MAWSAPLRWLRLGWRDLAAHPGIGMFYGLAFWCMALILGTVFRNKPEYTMTMASGCLLVGPLPGHATWHAYRGSVRWL